MLNGEPLQFPVSACSSGSNFLISPGHLWLRFCLSWFISVAEFGKNKLQGDSASRGTVHSEAVPLGRYMEQRLSNTLLNLYDVRTHCECHIPNTKEPKEGRVHLHLKHQQPWNQCLWKMGIRDCCQEDGHSAEEMVLRLSCLAYSHAILNRATKEMLLECQWDHLSLPHNLPLAVHLIHNKIQNLSSGLQDPANLLPATPSSSVIGCHCPGEHVLMSLAWKLQWIPKSLHLEAVSTLWSFQQSLSCRRSEWLIPMAARIGQAELIKLKEQIVDHLSFLILGILHICYSPINST